MSKERFFPEQSERDRAITLGLVIALIIAFNLHIFFAMMYSFGERWAFAPYLALSIVMTVEIVAMLMTIGRERRELQT